MRSLRETQESTPKFVKENDTKITNFCNPSEWGLQLKQNGFEDFAIHVDGQIIQIHKVLVSVESTVFKRMFDNGFKEAKENQVKIIDFNFLRGLLNKGQGFPAKDVASFDPQFLVDLVSQALN
uniref:BTB domain-containing protein n=1 Tax=Panagrolaimus sp. ES5 TaxID=591445 RepID=A0AC34FQH4_9BILA